MGGREIPLFLFLGENRVVYLALSPKCCIFAPINN